MNTLAQSLIIKTSPGQNTLQVGNSYITQATDQIIELTEHKSETGATMGIFVDDIRELRQQVRTSKKAVRTIVIIADAAKLRLEAQNALLKLLEEPREGLHFLLVTPHPEQLAPTILSRCQQVSAPPETAITLPEEKRARIQFMAAGNTAEENRLGSDDAYFEQQAKIFASAKQFLGGKKYQRITVISSVKESRDQALELIRATLIFANTVLRTRYSRATQQQIKALLEADTAIRKNGNVRLWLLKTVI